MEGVKWGFGLFFFYLFFWMPMVADASDSLLSPKGVSYEGMSHVGTSRLFFFFLYLLCFFFFFSYIFFFVLNLSFLDEAVAALMAVKNKMNDELHVMNGWDINSVDPCTWNMVACSAEGFVVSL
jgi:hypothetical protein